MLVDTTDSWLYHYGLENMDNIYDQTYDIIHVVMGAFSQPEDR